MAETVDRERVAATVADLADSLSSDYDVAQLLHAVVTACVELLDAQASGMLLRSAEGRLELVLVASTSEAARFIEVMQLNAGSGPCVETLRSGEPTTIADVEHASAEWADFSDAAQRAGFRSAHAIPLRIGAETVGSIGLFRARTGPLDRPHAELARALAALAAVAIVQERTARDGRVVAAQLQHALESRVAIEQAKGVLAASADIDMDEAFRQLRSHARNSNQKLQDVARAVADRKLDLTRLATRSGTRDA